MSFAELPSNPSIKWLWTDTKPCRLGKLCAPRAHASTPALPGRRHGRTIMPLLFLNGCQENRRKRRSLFIATSPARLAKLGKFFIGVIKIDYLETFPFSWTLKVWLTLSSKHLRINHESTQTHLEKMSCSYWSGLLRWFVLRFHETKL